MNGLEIIVLIILALCGFTGYRTGFLRVVYSLVAWILVLAFVTWATPYLTDYLEKNTEIKSRIQEQCLVYMEDNAADRIEEEQQRAIGDTGVWLPESILGKITDTTTETAGEILESTGLYEQIAESVAHFIIEGIAFFVALVFAGIVSRYLVSLLDLVSHLPVIHGANKMLGAAAGILKGLVIVWLAFYILALCAASEPGIQILTYVEESPILLYLYNNNILLQIIMKFL